MSQRGVVVTSHVRYSQKVYSPTIMEGEADILLSFEVGEAVRWLHYLKPGGRVITSLQRIVPPAIYAGMGNYPENPEATVRDWSENPILVDVLPMAVKLGNPRLVNTILLGIASTLLELSLDKWKTVIENRVPPKLKALNLAAFEQGRGLA